MTTDAAAARTVRIVLVLLILMCSWLSASTWRTFGHTWDEPEHLAAGLELLDRGRYEYDTEHPPIARVLIALLPYLAGAHSFGTPPPDGTQEGIDILYQGGHYDQTLTLARLGALPFLAILLVAQWLWAREVGASRSEALLAVALLASVPPILGHAGLAALDVPGAATTLLALHRLQKWILSGTWRNAAFFGLTLGLAVGTKLSAIPFIGIGVAVLAVARLVVLHVDGRNAPPERRSPRMASHPIASAWLALLCAAVPIVLAYGRRSVDLTSLPFRFQWVLPYLLHDGHRAISELVMRLQMPEAFWDFAEGIVALKAHNDTGHLSFLLGHTRLGGWWYFYLVALAVKTPLPLLVSGPIGLALLARSGWRQRLPSRLAPALLFIAILAFACFFSRINIGIRHVLILYPFLALGGAYAIASCWRFTDGLANRWRAAGLRLLLAVSVGWQLSTWWTADPDYLAYFNEAVRHPSHVLVDSDLDWGQDLKRLERRSAQWRLPFLHLAYRGTADLTREALPPFAPLLPGRPTTGWIAITALARAHDLAGYAWLDAYRPVETVGKTIDLYCIPQQTAVDTEPHPAAGSGSSTEISSRSRAMRSVAGGCE